MAQLFKVAHSSPPLTVLEVTTIYLFVGHSHVYLSFQPDLFTEFHTQNLTVLRTFQKRGRLQNATCPKGSSLRPLHACFSPQPPNLEMALLFPSLGTPALHDLLPLPLPHLLLLTPSFHFVFDHTRYVPSSRPLHLLFHLSRILFAQMLAQFDHLLQIFTQMLSS